jgi:hypothetical protein
LPQIIEKVTQMIGNGYEGGDGIVSVAGMCMEFDTVGEDSPHVELDGAGVFVLAASDGTAYVA